MPSDLLTSSAPKPTNQRYTTAAAAAAAAANDNSSSDWHPGSLSGISLSPSHNEHISANAHNENAWWQFKWNHPPFVPNNHFVLRLLVYILLFPVFGFFFSHLFRLFAHRLLLRVVLSFEFVMAFHAVKLKLNEFWNRLHADGEKCWKFAWTKRSKRTREREKKRRNKWKKSANH